ncbi:MAG: calcium-binding protein [Hyphomicrobiales bacterium]
MSDIFNELNQVFSGVIRTNNTAGQIFVTTDGLIRNAPGSALYLQNTFYDVKVDGIVSTSSVDTGIFYNSSSSGITSKLSVGATGQVHGGFAGVYASHAVNVTNAGYIDGGTFGLRINGGADAFTITNTGKIESAGSAITLLGTGKHTLTNKGVITGDVSGSNGQDIITNSGYLNGALSLGDGTDVVSNSGTIASNISLGDGADKFTNTGTLLSLSYISMGSGDDSFTGGKTDERVADEAGKDSYKLGDGVDIFLAIGTGSNDLNIDTVDGGSNTGADGKDGRAFGDIYFANMAIASLYVNLDTKAFTNTADYQNGHVLAAATASGAEVGTDKIKGFEVVLTGAGDDIVVGNAANNDISTGGGTDVIYGGAGNDEINAGNGLDLIFGGLGADFLNGGGVDASADYFYYTSVKDSTVALAGRDTIQQFEDGKDVIDLNGVMFNLPSTISVDDAFNGVLGQGDVRVITTQQGWTVQVDVNGDRKVDMAIDVIDSGHSNVSWSVADFN